MDLDSIQKTCKCCCCDTELAESEHVNMIMLSKQATWAYPIAGNVLDGQYGRAMAIICDTCYDLGMADQMKPIKYAIEFQKDQVIYHPIEGLSELN